MATHHLKTWPEYFAEVREGNKTFEVRQNDRGYQVGDTLVLEEYIPKAYIQAGRSDWYGHTGCKEYRSVTYILEGQNALMGTSFGLEEGYCILALGPAPKCPECKENPSEEVTPHNKQGLCDWCRML